VATLILGPSIPPSLSGEPSSGTRIERYMHPSCDC
jgi:hypothetical protein